MNMLRIRAAFAALAFVTLFAVSSSASTAPAQSAQPIATGSIPPPASYIQFCFGDGSSGPCPCANNSVPGANEGCVNSTGAGAMLSGNGNASISADSLVLTGTNLTRPAGGICIFVQGSAIIGRTPFGAGLRCFSGAILRIGVRPIVAGTSQLGFPITAMVSVLGGITSPGSYNYAVYYRDVGTTACPQNFNVTNGLKVNWVP